MISLVAVLDTSKFLRGKIDKINGRTYPAIMIPPATPHDRAAVYILETVSHRQPRRDKNSTYAMTAPRSCKKKTRDVNHISWWSCSVCLPSAIDRGAMLSAAPDANPAIILAARKLA